MFVLLTLARLNMSPSHDPLSGLELFLVFIVLALFMPTDIEQRFA